MPVQAITYNTFSNYNVSNYNFSFNDHTWINNYYYNNYVYYQERLASRLTRLKPLEPGVDCIF